LTSSGYFQARKEDPLDMDDAYSKIYSLVDKRSHLDYRQLGVILRHYEKKKGFIMSNMFYTYPSISIPLDDFEETQSEYAFACMTNSDSSARQHRDNILLYFVSDEYNINEALDVHTNEYIAARFIFRWGYSLSTLVALAEEPGTALSSLEQTVEDIYLQMRQFYSPSKFYELIQGKYHRMIPIIMN